MRRSLSRAGRVGEGHPWGGKLARFTCGTWRADAGVVPRTLPRVASHAPPEGWVTEAGELRQLVAAEDALRLLVALLRNRVVCGTPTKFRVRQVRASARGPRGGSLRTAGRPGPPHARLKASREQRGWCDRGGVAASRCCCTAWPWWTPGTRSSPTACPRTCSTAPRTLTRCAPPGLLHPHAPVCGKEAEQGARRPHPDEAGRADGAAAAPLLLLPPCPP